jgi:hypothetical protein
MDVLIASKWRQLDSKNEFLSSTDNSSNEFLGKISEKLLVSSTDEPDAASADCDGSVDSSGPVDCDPVDCDPVHAGGHKFSPATPS